MPGPRILVADDHDKVRAGIATLLASHFDVVATVRDGHEAVEAARTLSPDLVVLDISMPGLNGFQAGALIRDLPDPPRIVFATAHEDSSIANAAFALGASAVVQKREMMTELVPAVRRALLFHGVCFYEDSPSLARTVARFIGEGCCDSLIVSPFGLVRSVPLSWRPGRSRIGADGDECERVETGGRHGTRHGRDVEAGIGGRAAGH